MSFIENPLSNLRQLKGAPLSVLIAMWIVQQPVKVSWLGSITGYSPHSITSALVLLDAMQLVISDTHRSNWRLTDGVRQLPLMNHDISDREKRDPNDSPPPPPPSIRRDQHVFDESKGEEEALTNPDREKRDPNSKKNDEDESIYAIRRQVLYEYGVGEPVLSKLLDLPYTDLDYLLAHTTKAKIEELPANHLIQRIRAEDIQPNTNQHGHAIGCHCETCEPNKIIHCSKCYQMHLTHYDCEEELNDHQT